MKVTRKFSDARFNGLCAYCGNAPDTRDHVPSRILLDTPYPDNLPVVPCCSSCNNGFSLDEEYFACLIECILCGSTDAEVLSRESIKSVLRRKPALQQKIAQGKVTIAEGIAFQPEWNRVTNVVLKLLKGHAQFESSEAQYDVPDFLLIKPVALLFDEESNLFWAEYPIGLLPELGSRGFNRIYSGGDQLTSSWLVVQTGNYQYAVDFTPEGAVRVRIIVRNYLACMALW